MVDEGREHQIVTTIIRVPGQLSYVDESTTQNIYQCDRFADFLVTLVLVTHDICLKLVCL